MLRKGIFSENYSLYLQRRDEIKRLTLEAREFLKGCKLYGQEISLNNPEDLIASLYLLYKDKEMFHEPLR